MKNTIQEQPGLLRTPAFVLLFSGMAVSQLGDALYELALPVWVMQTTGSAREMALLTGVGTVVRLLVAPLAGTLADRTDRRLVMLLADLARGAIALLLALSFTGHLERFATLVGGTVLLAFAGAFFSPAYAAAQTGLVHPDDLTRSLSLWQMLRQALTLVGPGAAGAVIGVVGLKGAFALDGATFLFSMLCLLGLRLRWAPSPPKERKPFLADFRGAITTIVANRTVLRTILLGAGVNLAGAAFAVLLPVIGLRELGLTSTQYGLFQMVSPAGIMLGMLLLMTRAGGTTRRGRFMLWTLLAMGLSNVAMGLAFSPTFFLVLLFVGGLLFGLSNVMFAVIWRQLIPPEQQGRFFGLQGSLNQMLMPVGLALAGVLADLLSPYLVAAGAGALVVLLAIWGLSGRGFREIE